MMDPELKNILADNKRVLDRLEARMKKIEKRFIWGTVWSIVKIIIIVGPIVVGLIYLSPIINKYFQDFSPIFEFYSNLGQDKNLQQQINTFLGSSNANQQIPPEVLESFCNPQTRDVIVQQMCK